VLIYYFVALYRPKTGDPTVSTHVAHALRALNALKEEADCHDGELDPLDLGFEDGNQGFGTQDTGPVDEEGDYVAEATNTNQQRRSIATDSMIAQANSRGIVSNPSSQVILEPSSTSTSFSADTSRHLRNLRETNVRQSNSRNRLEQAFNETRDQNMKFKNFMLEREEDKERRQEEKERSEDRERKRRRKEKKRERKEARKERQWMAQQQNMQNIMMMMMMSSFMRPTEGSQQPHNQWPMNPMNHFSNQGPVVPPFAMAAEPEETDDSSSSTSSMSSIDTSRLKSDR